MRKRYLVLCLLCLSLVACGSNETSTETISSESKVEVVKKSVDEEPSMQKDFEGEYEEIGEGTFYISSDSGSTENGEDVFLFASQTEYEWQSLWYGTWDFDGTHLTYIYVDGMETEKEQMQDFASSLYLENMDENLKILKENPLKEGFHTVECVQYDNDKPDGNVILYRKLQYEVKAK